MSAMSDSQVREIARPILGEMLKPVAVEDVFVRAEDDFDGEEILRMTARVSAHVSARQIIDATYAVMMALRGQNDPRYVFLDARTLKQETAVAYEDEDVE